jgi:starvation-inducible DNA-binding protein
MDKQANPKDPAQLFGLSTENRQRVAQELQGVLPSLIDLALRLKQAHWNLRGARFKSVHEQLDEVLLDVRGAVDDVAERIVTLDVPANGLSRTVVADSHLGKFPEGRLDVTTAILQPAEDLDRVAHSLRSTLSVLAEVDPISEDLVIGIAGTLEKHQWMLRSQLEDPTRT